MGGSWSRMTTGERYPFFRIGQLLVPERANCGADGVLPVKLGPQASKASASTMIRARRYGFGTVRSPSAYAQGMFQPLLHASFAFAASTPEAGVGANLQDSEPAISLMMILVGVCLATLIAIMVLVALRRSLGRSVKNQADQPVGVGKSAGPVESNDIQSPWAIAGQRASPEPSNQPPPDAPGGPSIDVPGDADPNDDTWQGPNS